MIPLQVRMMVTFEKHWQGREEGFWHAGDNQFLNLGSGHTGIHLCFMYFSACGVYLITRVMTKRKFKVASWKTIVPKVHKITTDNSVYVLATFLQDNMVLNSSHDFYLKDVNHYHCTL